jgi:hypothetical protein
MKSECMEAVALVIGRRLTQPEAKGIDDRISAKMRELARTDQNWQTYTPGQRLVTAAEAVEKDFIGEVALKTRRAAQAVNALARAKKSLDDAAGKGERMFRGLADDMRKSEVYIKGVQREAWSGMLDAIMAAEPRFLGLLENPQAVRDFVQEVFTPGATGNKLAQAGAKAWTEQAELLRQRFNNAGGDVGKLDYGYLPQPHDQNLVRNAGREQWTAFMADKLDARRYLNEDGSMQTVDQLRAMLDDVYTTISTGGANKIEPGKITGSSALAAKHGKPRELHFRDADAWLEYMSQFGRGQLFDGMQGHVHRLSADIGMVERYGPNPQQTFDTLYQVAYKDAAMKGEKLTDMVQVGGVFAASTKSMWHNLSGKANIVKPENAQFAEINQGVRNLEVAGMLGKAVFSALADFNSYFLTTRFNKVPFNEALVNIVKAQSKEAKDFANKAGLMQEGFVADVHTMTGDNIINGWTGKAANLTMKATLLSGLTDAVRRAFSVGMMGAMGKLSKVEWSKLDADDRARLTKQGIDEADWAVISKAKPEDWRGSDMLTPESIRSIDGVSDADKNRVVAKVLGLITDESEYASVAPDLYGRSIVTGQSEKGTAGGEFRRHVMLFKGTPIAMVTRHVERALTANEVGQSRVGYAAQMAVAGTILGASVIQLKDMMAGKDPRDMTDAKFWGAAMAQGGGLGIAGDFLYTSLTGKNRGGNSAIATLAGPTAGQLERGLDGLGYLADGEIEKAGDTLYRTLRSMTPGVNVWYAQSVLDHAFLMDLQEYLSPGFVRRMEQRARKDYDQDFYWQPDEMLPSRAPDVGAAVGG